MKPGRLGFTGMGFRSTVRGGPSCDGEGNLGPTLKGECTVGLQLADVP